MIVIDPNETTHTIELVPRYYPSLSMTLDLYNESSKVTSTPANTYFVDSGILKVTFDYTFLDKQKYQVKLGESNSIVFRGKITVTAQNTQEYKLTDGVYEYE